MLTEKQISALRASFPAEALSADNSRGFELTSIKAAFVVERLNEVFGPCGCGWRYVHSPFEWIEGEVLTEVALQFKVADGDGMNPVVWDTQVHGWAFVQDGEAWSWPIFSPGGRRPNKGNTPLTDARKGAITDGLTKAASMIGVGHEVFRGLVRPSQAYAQPTKVVQPVKKPEPAPEPATAPDPKRSVPVKPQAVPVPANGHPTYGTGNGKTNGAAVQMIPVATGTEFRSGNGSSNGAGHAGARALTGTEFRSANGNGDEATVTPVSATTFWMLANKHAARLDRASVSALAKDVVTGKMSWLEAQTILHDMIEDTSVSILGGVSSPLETIQEKATGKVVQYAEKVSDPLDELFA